MGDLISRQAAIDAIDRERKNKHLFNTAEDGLLEARGVINTLPSAEPERKKGKWIANGDIHKECPFCGEDWDKYVFGDVVYTGELPKFCPNCGEDMRGEQDDKCR